MQYDNVTLDLETIDTRTSAKILSIGVVPFNWDEQVSFEELCNRESSLYLKIDMASYPAGFTESEDTKQWWEKQGEAARHVLQPSPSDLIIQEALIRLQLHLQTWVEPMGKDGAQIYCRGYDFDGGILEHAYQQYQFFTPWAYNRFRCIRTTIDILAGTRNGYLLNDDPEGFIKHHALHDAAKDTLTMLNLHQSHHSLCYSDNTVHHIHQTEPVNHL